MITCKTCKITKPTEFYTESNQKINGRCKECSRKYSKQHYLKNKNKYNQRDKATRDKYTEILTIKKNSPCMDCGVEYPHYVMDFDHREPEKKHFSVSSARRMGKSLKLMLEEIDKCDVVCANCHRVRTYKKYYPEEK